MDYEKRVIGAINKCYAICGLHKDGDQHFLVAAEKPEPGVCYEYDSEGRQVSTLWETPGGTMTITPVPGCDDTVMATQRFYSPNDSKEAVLVLAQRQADGKWQVKPVAALPHVHRFGFLPAGEGYYLIACTICSGRDFKDDWSYPGKVYAWYMEGDIGRFNLDNPIPFTVIREGLVKNHGFWMGAVAGRSCALIASQEGVFAFYPPPAPGGEWQIDQWLSEPTSDMTLVDFDGDGQAEMLTFAPFHGETVRVYKKRGDVWETVYTLPEAFEFAHAIWGCEINGVPAVLMGHRRGDNSLRVLWYDKGVYRTDVIDEGAGPANAWCFEKDGKTRIVATNRETDEVALYIPR